MKLLHCIHPILSSGSLGNSPFRTFHELHHVLYLRGHLHFFLDPGQGLGGVQVRPEDDAVGFFHRVTLLLGKSPPGKTQGVQSEHFQWVAKGLGIRQDVLLYRRGPAHNGVAAHPGELVDRGQPADDGEILYYGVPGQSGRVGQDHAVANDALVGHVGVGHQQAVAPDLRHLALDGGKGDGGELPDHGPVAYDHPGLCPPVFQVLGVASYRRSVPDPAVPAQLGPFVDGHRVADDAAVAQHALRADDGEGADRDVVA